MMRAICHLCCLALMFYVAGCQSIPDPGQVAVNAVVWAIALPLEEAGVIKPRHGQRPARDYFLGYRIDFFDGRRMYRKEEEGKTVNGVIDSDGGRSTVTIDQSTGEKSYESFTPANLRRPIPEDSLAFLNKYAY